MFARILSLSITVTSAAFVSYITFLTALWVGNLYDQTQGGKPLPGISHLFYPPATAIYYFPVPLFLYGLVTVIWCRRNADLCYLCCVVALSTTLMFMSAAGFGLALPFLPMKIYKKDRPVP